MPMVQPSRILQPHRAVALQHGWNPTSDCIYDVQDELRVGVGDTDICNKVW
jgi:hypothetical protein